MKKKKYWVGVILRCLKQRTYSKKKMTSTVTQKVLLAMARERDEAKLREIYETGLYSLCTATGLSLWHLAAYIGNEDFFLYFVTFMKTADVDYLDTFSMFLTTEAKFPVKDGPPKMFTPVHLAVLAGQVEVLKTLSYLQRAYDNVGYYVALATPADEELRPKALSKAMYGKDHQISDLVHVIKDPAGKNGPAMPEEEQNQLRAQVSSLFEELEDSETECTKSA
jgi:hypothetical protein